MFDNLNITLNFKFKYKLCDKLRTNMIFIIIFKFMKLLDLCGEISRVCHKQQKGYRPIFIFLGCVNLLYGCKRSCILQAVMNAIIMNVFFFKKKKKKTLFSGEFEIFIKILESKKIHKYIKF